MWNIILSLCVFLSARASLDSPLWETEYPGMDTSRTKAIDDSYYDSNSESRLEPFVIPLEYEIFFEMYFEERIEKPYSYDGHVFITIKVLGYLNEIMLHSAVDIQAIRVFTKVNNVPVPLSKEEPYRTDSRHQILTVNIEGNLDRDTLYVLSINFSKSLHNGPMKGGPFKGYYYDEEGIERAYASAYFQPNTARYAFPCFDEPKYKAVFYLHISRPAAYRQTYSNTMLMSADTLDNNRVRDHFSPTPKMSAYGITFLISEKIQVIAVNSSMSPPVRIIGAPSAVGLGDHALKVIVDSLQFFNQYFDLPYSSFSRFLTNDHVASPDWATGATENWGLVSYREAYAVLNLSETMMSIETYSTTLFTHEVAHQWFGNLITCNWWSNTWLNEGFASYLGLYAADQLYPKYKLNEFFNFRYVSKALEYDSGGGANPLYYINVNTPSEIKQHFGTVSYNKGASFIRMTADIISHETFQKVCQILLKTFAFDTVDHDDIFSAFELAIKEDNEVLMRYPNFHFQEYYKAWVEQPGYPLLTVDVDHTTGEMKLNQSRFNNPHATNTYPIPITYSSKSYKNFENVIPTSIMTKKQMLLYKSSDKEWVIFNHLQHGYYRVMYDNTTWDLITEALLYTRDDIHHLNRAQIVDDVFAYMRHGHMTFSRGFKILRFLRYEDNFNVWLVAFTGYKWMREKLLHFPNELATFDSFLLSYLEHAIKTLGFEPAPEESPTVSMARKEILEMACDLGHQQCVEDAVRRFTAWRDNDTWVNPQIRRHVYRSGIREGGKEDFDFLLNRFNNSRFLSDKLEILRGLAVTRHADLLDRFMDLTVSKAVRPHDKVDIFTIAADENPGLVMDYIKRNIDAIRVGYIEGGPKAPVHVALGYLSGRLNETELDEYENWAKTVPSIPQYGVIISTVKIARSVINWGKARADAILQAVADNAAYILTSKILVFVMTFFTIVL